jgi:sulfur carrier protein ThiS
VPAITVGLPASLTAPGPARDYALEAGTVHEALRALVEQAPQYAQRVFYRDRLLVVVTLNGKHLQPSRVGDTGLSAGDRLDILMPVAGG